MVYIVGEVLHHARVQVVEQSIDRQVAAERIRFGVAKCLPHRVSGGTYAALGAVDSAWLKHVSAARRAKSWCRCGRADPSPGADVAGAYHFGDTRIGRVDLGAKIHKVQVDSHHLLYPT